jgi:mono/diheme cytochrome c family protein
MAVRGQERFNIYCSACHGYEGEGSDVTALTGGLVGRRWNYNVPSLHDPKYKDASVRTGLDGYLFHTIRHGVPEIDPAKPPKMPGYADKISVADSWAVVAYVRALQSSRTTTAPRAAVEGTPVSSTTQTAEARK